MRVYMCTHSEIAKFLGHSIKYYSTMIKHLAELLTYCLQIMLTSHNLWPLGGTTRAVEPSKTWSSSGHTRNHTICAHYICSYLCRTDPADVARVEGKTFIVTDYQYDSVPHVAEDTKGILGQWMSPNQFKEEASARYPGSMRGRTMYVIPFSMGPVGSPLARIGIQLTDFAYVVLSMRVMTRIGARVLKVLGDGEFVQCVHTVGCPLPLQSKICTITSTCI